MKGLSLLLLVSLLTNGVLVARLIRSHSSTESVPAAIPPGTGKKNSSAANSAPAPGHPAPALSANPDDSPSSVHAAPAATASFWSLLQTEDLGEFRRRLQAAGFPPREVRELIAATIMNRAAAKRDALMGNPDDMPYWRTASFPSDPQRNAKFFAISRESSALSLQYLSEPDALADDYDALAAAQRRYGNLSVAKLQQLRMLDWKLEEKRSAIYQENFGSADQSTESHNARQAALLALETERMTEAGRLLTPDELEQFELRDSSISNSLRSISNVFQPTEAEFKALVAIERNRRQSTSNNDTPENPSSSRAQWLAQAQSVLSPGRYADLQALMNAGSDNLTKLIVRLELPLSTISTVNTIRDDLGERAKTILNNDNLPVAQRNAQIASLASEADTKLTSALGTRGYEAYAEIKGDWIRALKNPELIKH